MAPGKDRAVRCPPEAQETPLPAETVASPQCQCHVLPIRAIRPQATRAGMALQTSVPTNIKHIIIF